MFLTPLLEGGKPSEGLVRNECVEESEDRYNWLELARGGFPLPQMAAFKFAANKPRCLFLRCFLSCNTSVPLEKIFS